MNDNVTTILSMMPIVVLLTCLIFLKLSPAKSGLVSLASALLVAFVFFGFKAFGLSVAVGKALALALFVSLIVWFALFMYHLADEFKALEVINKNIVIFIEDRFVAFLLLAWLFSGLLQGMAGFGVPIVIITPILISLGISKITALSAALLGHSWAVTFGSMGAAFFIIEMITGVPAGDLAVPAWIFNTSAHFLTGLGVCWLYGGLGGIKKGLPYILPVSAAMTISQYFTLRYGMYSISSLSTALTGLTVMCILYKLREKRAGQLTKPALYSDKLNFFQVTLPYVLILTLSLAFQFLPSEFRDISLSFNFPASETTLGYEASAEIGYSRILLFGHPSLILLCASAAAIITYKCAGVWDSALFCNAVKSTVKKAIPATLTLLALGNMSLVMMDSGMTDLLAYSAANMSGKFYPIFAPFFGVLGSFLTGNNTNANVLFGVFQQTIAQQLSVDEAIMLAAQSISGSVGVAVGPTLILMGAISSKQIGVESLIYKKIMPIILLIALIMGIINYILLR
ncbi:MAG: L-lactate permease [Oscillospiraceae bacterium]|nr:L-lactate permease [Oscillospiraceae bacterium]